MESQTQTKCDKKIDINILLLKHLLNFEKMIKSSKILSLPHINYILLYCIINRFVCLFPKICLSYARFRVTGRIDSFAKRNLIIEKEVVRHFVQYNKCLSSLLYS